MQLKHIKQEKCSVCGSRIIAESQTQQHCNGQWNETRKFECGATLHYSPNFQALHNCIECPKHPDNIQKIKNHTAAKEKIINYIKRIKTIDDDFKKRLLTNIEYTKIH